MLALLALVSANGAEALTIGEPVPPVTLTDLQGNLVNTADLLGKTVVLEWFNPGCPYVEYAHADGPLKEQAAQSTAGGDVVWIAVNSGAPGKQGHGVELNQQAAETWSMTHPILPDETGVTGQAYAAKTTPHMYVIDPEGKLAYQGAIDNQPLGRNADQAHVNYVEKALTNLAAGQPVETPQTQPYGCSVKY